MMQPRGYDAPVLRNEPPVPPVGWQMELFEVIPGLLIGTKIMPPAEYATMGVGAIVDLENWDFAWAPRVPSGSLYLSFPIEDDDLVDPKVSLVASFVAALVRSGQRVLVHCTEGLNRSGLVVAQALVELGWDVADAIELVRQRRGVTRDGFSALSNERFVEWLLAERSEAPERGGPGDDGPN